jgi:hypothetical protein
MYSLHSKPLVNQLAQIGILACLGCAAGYASTITTPAGLAPGTQYQLVFVTNDGVLGDLADISDYNTFVANEAAQNPTLAAFDAATGATWTVIGSTGLVDADVNSPSTGLVYTLDGAEVASIGVYGVNAANPEGSSLLNPIDINQFGDFENTFVWTGSGSNGFAGNSGTSFGGSGNGFNGLGGTFPSQGNSTGLTSRDGGPSWVEGGTGAGVGEGNNLLAVYAISSVITVATPSNAPEPATFALIPGALAVLYAVRRKRRSIS